MQQSEATFQVLYKGSMGALDLEDGNDGVLLILSVWFCGNYHATSHYMIEKRVLIDGEYALNSSRLETVYSVTEWDMIQKAVHEYEDMVSNHPMFCKEFVKES